MTMGTLAWKTYYGTFGLCPGRPETMQNDTFVARLGRLIQTIEDRSRPSFIGCQGREISSCMAELPRVA